MVLTSEFYLARAAESAREAENATLGNVRDRCRRSEAAWLSMADSVAVAEATRAELIAIRAANADRSGR